MGRLLQPRRLPSYGPDGDWGGYWGKDGPELDDSWVARMRSMPTTVVSSSLEQPVDWPDVTIERGDAVEVVRRLKQESDVPLRSHGSLSLNWSLLAAGLVDVVQVTVFPVLTGITGTSPVFEGAGDVDLELLESRRAAEPHARRAHAAAGLPADAALITFPASRRVHRRHIHHNGPRCPTR